MAVDDCRCAFGHDFDYSWFDLQEKKMKRLLVSAILSAIALSVIGGLTGCAASGLVTYANSEKYSVGDAKFTEKIENIEIDWASGSVSIVSHPENTFLLSEKTDDGIPEKLRVHWWLDGTTLHVRFSAPGASLRTRPLFRWQSARGRSAP